MLADDLTGAAASASCLAEAGFRSEVLWGECTLSGALDCGCRAVCVDMRNRDYFAEPGSRAMRWARRLVRDGFQHLELRMDSTLRGAPAEELAGVLEGAGLDDPVVIAVPAFPEAGRVTVGGVQQASRGASGVGRHDVAASVFGDDCTVVRSTWSHSGTTALLCEISERVSAGSRRFVLDATTEAQLKMIAAAVRTLWRGSRPVVTVSPGSWLRHLGPRGTDGGHSGPNEASAPDRSIPMETDSSGRFVLVVLSSPTELNRQQLAVLQSRTGARRYDADGLLRVRSEVAWSRAGEDPAVIVVDTVRSRPTSMTSITQAWAWSTVAARAALLVLEKAGPRAAPVRAWWWEAARLRPASWTSWEPAASWPRRSSPHCVAQGDWWAALLTDCRW